MSSLGGPGRNLNRASSTNSSSGSLRSNSLSAGSNVPSADWGNQFSVDEPDPPYGYEEIPIPPPQPGAGGIPLPPPFPDSGSDCTGTYSPSVTSSEEGFKRCVALYPYDNANMEESSIPMFEGEEFFIVDDDCDGWTRVRRVISNHEFGEEGFVPTTWIKIL